MPIAWHWRRTGAALLPTLPPSLYTSLSCLPPPSLSLALSPLACLQAGHMQSKSSARQTLRWHFRAHFRDAANTHTSPTLPSHHLPPLAACTLPGRGRSVVSPFALRAIWPKAVILLLAKYKSECCANYSQQGKGQGVGVATLHAQLKAAQLTPLCH